MLDPVLLDVSDLEPPEPLTRVIATLQRLPAGTLLIVRHRRDPIPLYPMLAEMGFAHRCRPRSDGAVTLYIWPQDDRALAARAVRLDSHAH